jgi:hypothetical protein
MAAEEEQSFLDRGLEDVEQANFSVGDKTTSTFGYAYSTNVLAKEMPARGTKSLFNNYTTFYYINAGGDYNRLYDINGQGPTPGYSRNPTAANIIKFSLENSGSWQPFGAAPYSYSDFLYCKYYGKIPNNYMVTLRRYPVPMLDNLKTPDGRNVPPIAQAITWMSEELTENKMSEILKFSMGLAWKEIEASVQEVTGNERGFENSPLASVPGGSILAGIQGFLNPREYSGQAQAESNYAQTVYGSEGPYANKVYGPVNVVHKTMARDRGLEFENDITLNFHYHLASYDGINPKMAMLDIIGNMMTLCYNNAKFWGGAIRYFPQHPNVPFFGDQKAFYAGDVGGYIDSLMTEFSSLGSKFMETFSKLIQDPLAALKELATGAGKFVMGKSAAKDRPQIIAMRSLLTGAPVGEWHLVVGNPMNPIAMIGNLICTNLEITLGDMLGADDFPTEVTFTVSLKHGKPRDKGDIESMFNLGNGRMYYGINDDAVFSSTRQSVIDTSGSRGDRSPGAGTTPNTPAQNAAQIQGSDSRSANLSMWGYKFLPEELKVSQTWAGSADKNNSLSGK